MNPQSQGLMRAITGPIVLITVGTLFTVERFAGVPFSQTWPVLLIVIGVLKLLGGRRPRRGDAGYYVPPYAPPSGLNTPPYTPPAQPYTTTPDPFAPPPPPVPGERR